MKKVKSEHIKFSRLKLTDISTCVSIMCENYEEENGGFWSNILIQDLSEIIKKSKSYSSQCILIKYKRKTIGFGAYMQSRLGHNIYELPWVNICKPFQNVGAGTFLMYEMEKCILKNETLYNELIILLTTDKQFFYKKLGYKVICRAGNEDIMVKLLRKDS